MKKRKVKTKAKVVTKGSLVAQVKELQGKIEWATSIISMQQKEIDRLITLNDKLISSINNMSARDT